MNEETIYDQAPRAEKSQQKKPLNQVKKEAGKKPNAPEGMRTEKPQQDAKKNKNSSWTAAGIAGAAGMAAGILTPKLVFSQNGEEVEAEVPNEAASGHHVGHDLDVATCVDDSMTFSEAFAAAREEVGAGGLFVWHGHTYGTYYADEWNAMSPDDVQQYWADVYHTTAHVNTQMSGGVASGTGTEQNLPPDDQNVLASGGEEPPVNATGEGDPVVPLDPPGGWDGNGEPVLPSNPGDPGNGGDTLAVDGLPIDMDGDGYAEMVITDVNDNGVADILHDTTGDGVYDEVSMDVPNDENMATLIGGAADPSSVTLGTVSQDLLSDASAPIVEPLVDPDPSECPFAGVEVQPELIDEPCPIGGEDEMLDDHTVAFVSNPDLDPLASSMADPGLPIDNGMDMGQFV